MVGLALVMAAIVGIFYVWSLPYNRVNNAGIQIGRPKTALVANLAVTFQPVMAILILTPLGRYKYSIASLTLCEVLLFLVALPCILMRRDRSRWWLLFSSIVFVAFYFGMLLVSVAE